MFSNTRGTPGLRGVGRAALALLVAGFAVACQDGPLAPLTENEGEASESVMEEGDLAMASFAADQAGDAWFEAEAERNRTRPDDQRRPDVDRVGLVVRLSGTSISLATRILEEQGADAEQKRFLEAAKRLQRKAVAALAQGDTERAVAYAIEACWTALKAIILPGGVTDEEVRFIHDLAHDLLEEAIAKVGDARSIDQTLLDWAIQFYVVGAQQLEDGDVRGVASLWKSAVISAHILG